MLSMRPVCVSLALLMGWCAAFAGLPEDSTAGVEPAPSWEGGGYLYYYALPADDDFPLVIAAADRGALHIEARYNYEDLKTGSLFAGWNLSGGESLEYRVTPMAGLAFGQTNGLVPALELSLATGAFDLYVESEYLLDFEGSAGNFFYTWSELAVTLGPVRTGLAAQRTRIFQTPLELNRGLFAQLTQGPATFSIYAFNIATESDFLIFGLALEF